MAAPVPAACWVRAAAALLLGCCGAALASGVQVRTAGGERGRAALQALCCRFPHRLLPQAQPAPGAAPVELPWGARSALRRAESYPAEPRSCRCPRCAASPGGWTLPRLRLVRPRAGGLRGCPALGCCSGGAEQCGPGTAGSAGPCDLFKLFKVNPTRLLICLQVSETQFLFGRTAQLSVVGVLCSFSGHLPAELCVNRVSSVKNQGGVVGSFPDGGAALHTWAGHHVLLAGVRHLHTEGAHIF